MFPGTTSHHAAFFLHSLFLKSFCKFTPIFFFECYSVIRKGEEELFCFNTPDKQSTQWWKDRSEYFVGGCCDGKYLKMTKKLFYISCKGNN
jgi:hypothetical protein